MENIINTTVLKNNKNFKLIKAFSLIELSIVLIIMGLLVAGIVGGQSLIQSAKARTFLNELNGWKQSFNAFYVAKGRFPGDIKNKGIFGYESGYSYPAGTFASPYDTSAQGVYNAPYIEMYLEKVSDFEPLSGNCNDDFANVKAKCVPLSNVLKNSFYEFVYYNRPAASDINNWRYGLKQSNYLMLIMDRASGSDKDSTNVSTIKLLKYADEKTDDGKHNGGNIRTTCKGVDSEGAAVASGTATYDQAIDALEAKSDGYCKTLTYWLGI